jgi:hypothetical protein
MSTIIDAFQIRPNSGVEHLYVQGSRRSVRKSMSGIMIIRYSIQVVPLCSVFFSVIPGNRTEDVYHGFGGGIGRGSSFISMTSVAVPFRTSKCDSHVGDGTKCIDALPELMYVECPKPETEVNAIVSSSLAHDLFFVVALCSESLSLTSVRILRNSGRRMAIEAATIPVPGSAVAQIVAYTASAVSHKLHVRRVERTITTYRITRRSVRGLSCIPCERCLRYSRYNRSTAIPDVHCLAEEVLTLLQRPSQY